MIRIRLAGALVAGSLAVGLVAGSAGTMIASDEATPPPAVATCIDHMDDMGSYLSGQGGPMMSGRSGGIMSGRGGGMMSGVGPVR